MSDTTTVHGFMAINPTRADMFSFLLQLESELATSKATIKQMHKDYGHECRDPNGTIWEEAARLQKELAASQAQLAAMTKEANDLEELKNHNAELFAASQARCRELESFLVDLRDNHECDDNCDQSGRTCISCRAKILLVRKDGKG
jgi:chromosome segregation ATPase